MRSEIILLQFLCVFFSFLGWGGGWGGGGDLVELGIMLA